MKFLRFFLFCLCLALVVFCVGWVNIWVPSNHVAIVRVEPFKDTQKSPSSVSLVTRKGFSWLWQRLVPGLSSLVVLENTPRTYAFDARFTLPQAFEYAAFSGENIEAFTVDARVQLEYALANKDIAAYVETHGITSAYALERIVLTEISSAAARLLRENSPRITENTTALAMQESIKANLTSHVATLPIVLQSVTVHISNKPNIALYKYVQRSVEAALTGSTNGGALSEAGDGFKNNKDALLFYLHFIQRLNGLANANPKIKDIMQIIPPQDILPE